MRLRLPGRLLVVALPAVSACAALFSSGPRPRELTGLWLDSSTSTPAESSYGHLTAHGAQRPLRVVAARGVDGAPRVERNESWAGQWWHLTGRLSDTAHRALCFTVRPNREGACYRF